MVVGGDINEISKSIPLFVPNLDEIVPHLRDFLKQNFAECNVEVVTCPDLNKPPFSFTGVHLGHEDLAVIDVGGPGNLFPDVRVDKVFDAKKIAKNALPEASKTWVFGPGAGPRHIIGVNCEAVIDATFSADKDDVQTHTVKISNENAPAPLLKTVDSSDFCLMANLGVTDISKPPGKVLKIEARERIGKLNFAEAIRQFFVKEYPEESVSLAGVFAIKEGSIKVHVMPDFPESLKFEDREKFNKSWLQYFEISSPISCASVIHNRDAHNLSLRLEHTHCFNEGEGSAVGGHYHYDTTPKTIHYEGYFAPAQILHRIDQVQHP